MNIDHLLNLTGTVTDVALVGAEDAYGNPTESTTSRSIKCWIHQTSAEEQGRPSGVDSEDFTLYAPADSNLSTLDRVEVLGVTYEVSGEPWDAIDPRSATVVYQRCHVRRADRG